MAGLLDAFNDPQFQRGLLMFAASTPMSEQQRAGLLSYMDNQEQAKLQREYMGLQMEGQRGQNEANRAKLATTKAKADFDNQLFGSLMGGGRPQGAGFAPGAVAPDGSRANPAAGDGFIASLTPDQLAALSMRGHDFTKAWELTRPDMQVSNGYAYDKRNLGAGFMPSLQTTAEGKSTMTQIGPNGLPVVSAPQGALDTYGVYKGVDHLLGKDMEAFRQRSSAEWAGQEVIDPRTGRKVLTSRANALGRGGNPSVGYTGDPYTDAVMHTESRGNPNAVSSAGALGVMQTMPNTLKNPGFGVTPARDNSPAELQRVGVEYLGKMNERYGDPAIAAVAYNWGPGNADKWLADGGDFRKLPKETQDYVGQVMLRTGINRTQGAGQPQNVVGFSPQEEATQNADRIRAEAQARADVATGTKQVEAAKKSGQLISVMDEAIGLLRKGPTASLTGAGVDMVTNAVGMPTKGAELAQQLEALSGWAVANVPRMEGPQSDRDVMNYMTMAGRVGDRTLPTQVRIAAAEQVKSLQQKYSHLNPSGQGAESAKQAAQPTRQSFSDYGYANAQEMLRDAQNAIMRNPGARAEVMRRLSEVGLSLNSGGASGSF